ncbi:uncharacterized protein LOC141588047 [Silene latifolia]|uniref:uncharacterized protein LOC141588047 n=1 Tax=Silene latifolia TaxID=37657 RepID=UPI003D76BC90
MEDGDMTFQIKTMNLEHICVYTTQNRMVTAEFLADKYLEVWRSDPHWRLKATQDKVKLDLGVDVRYHKCWVARARAKMIIWGNSDEQYNRVWDYAKTIIKYNPGSSSYVMVDRVDRPPPVFQRMYICLAACKEGFKSGCRPLIGVDGCHLKGMYPGMCLATVAMDGNNNLFPVAWAVVEVENADSWKWFLDLLVKDIGFDEGEGLTMMSDRQKVEYLAALEGIKFLSQPAYEHVKAIPPKHWSRHAFITTCKSSMITNNLCEPFNAVLKDARDKPILTQMEWMRRYIMKRHYEKRERANKYEKPFMPYIDKCFKRLIAERRYCKIYSSRNTNFEVDYKGGSFTVKLINQVCNCKHWELSGIPCVHAMACILEQRHIPEDYVDQAYSKDKYLLAYTPAIDHMPGVAHWEKFDQEEPLPPLMRRMPGRPSKKKKEKRTW